MELALDWYRAAVLNGSIDANGRLKVFDWDKLASLINEHQPRFVYAALEGDANHPDTMVYANGRPTQVVPTIGQAFWYNSTWAIPSVRMEIGPSLQIFTCWKYWDMQPQTLNETWPPSALSKLKNYK